MSTLKKTIFVWGGALLLRSGIFVSANYVPAIATSGLPVAGDCSISRSSKMYLPEDSDLDQKKDYRAYLRDNFMMDVPGAPKDYDATQIYQTVNVTDPDNSKLYYYAPEANMLSKKGYTETNFTPFNNTTFQVLSRVFPYNIRVRGIDSNDVKILFEQPIANPQNKTVNVRYYYNYKTAEWRDVWTSPYYYYPVGNSWNFSQMLNGNKVLWTGVKRDRSVMKQFASCQSFDLYRCGDGIVNPYTTTGNRADDFTGEICDDGANNGQPWYCDLNCGQGGWAFTCGDKIINDGSSATVYTSGGLMYGPTYLSGWIEMIEQCDDWPWDDTVEPPVWNHDGYQFATCAGYCEKNTEPEQLPEELGQ